MLEGKKIATMLRERAVRFPGWRSGTAALVLLAASLAMFAQTPAPELVNDHGRHALLVDGAPYLILGGQIGNSSAWPALLPEVWPALEALHANAAAAPVYWEQIEPEPGQFDWTNVDALIDGARAHHLHLILLWFGTWKNGNDHYVPQWVKRDPGHFPRMINSAGTPLDDLSANSDANMDADRKAFAALMHHLAERDAREHTVLMMQVENESGGIGAARDFSPASNREFAGQVPQELVQALGRKAGNWAEVFPGNADEAFQAWHQARYVNAVAEAGKRELNIPFYCNVWVQYPPSELPERRIPIAGIGYPSGGPNQAMLPIWKVAAPSIDLIGPDVYSDSPGFVENLMETYTRPDNPLWIPETGKSNNFAPFFFTALEHGAIGFSPFGIDWSGSLPSGTVPAAHEANFALLGPMQRTVARLSFDGKIKTFLEVAGGKDQEKVFPGKAACSSSVEGALLDPARLANAMVPIEQAGTAATRAADACGDWVAEARFGFPQRDGQPAPGNETKAGRVLVAELGPDDFLVTGIGAAVFFHRPGLLPGIRAQILEAEEGYYTPGPEPGSPEVWHRIRNLNGDETDRGIMLPNAEEQRQGAAAQQAASGDPTPTSPPSRKMVIVHVRMSRF